MPGKWKSKQTPIGLDFGTYGFKVIQGSWDGETWHAISAAIEPLPLALPQDKAERTCLLKERLAGALANGSFNGKDVVSSIPASMWQCKSLRLPPMPRNELRTAVEFEAADRLHLGTDHYIEFYDAGEVQQGEDVKREVIVLAVSHAVIDEHVEVLASCGLSPLAIDITPSALAEALSSKDNADSESAIQFTLDIGAVASKVVISRHGRVLFYKSIAIGVQAFDEAISNALKTPTEESSLLRRDSVRTDTSGSENRDSASIAVADALRPVLTDLAREVGLCLRYYSVTFRGFRPSELIVTGGGADTVLLQDRLAQEAGIGVTLFQGMPNFNFSALAGRASAAPTSCWTVAAGLTMRPVVQNEKRGAA